MFQTKYFVFRLLVAIHGPKLGYTNVEKGWQQVNSINANKTEMGAFLSQHEKTDIKQIYTVIIRVESFIFVFWSIHSRII